MENVTHVGHAIPGAKTRSSWENIPEVGVEWGARQRKIRPKSHVDIRCKIDVVTRTQIQLPDSLYAQANSIAKRTRFPSPSSPAAASSTWSGCTQPRKTAMRPGSFPTHSSSESFWRPSRTGASSRTRKTHPNHGPLDSIETCSCRVSTGIVPSMSRRVVSSKSARAGWMSQSQSWS